MGYIFHITREENWYEAKLKGKYDFCTLHSEGFIHCSKKHQVKDIVNSLFKRQKDLVVLKINETGIQSEIKYEKSETCSDLYPHIYGPIDLEAVEDVILLKTDRNGEFIFPDL